MKRWPRGRSMRGVRVIGERFGIEGGCVDGAEGFEVGRRVL